MINGKWAAGPKLIGEKTINSDNNMCKYSDGSTLSPIWGSRPDWYGYWTSSASDINMTLKNYLNQTPKCPVSSDPNSNPFIWDKGKLSGWSNWILAVLNGTDFNFLYPNTTD